MPFHQTVDVILGDEDYEGSMRGEGRWGANENDRLLRFIILYADPNSPYSRITDFDYRKDVIIKEFLIGVCEEKPQDKLITEIAEENDIFYRFLFWYFIIINDTDYEHWFTYKTLLRNLFDTLRNPSSVQDSALLSVTIRATDKIESLKRSALELESKLFKDPMVRAKLKEKAADPNAGFAERFAKEGFALKKTNQSKSNEEVIKERIFSVLKNDHER